MTQEFAYLMTQEIAYLMTQENQFRALLTS